MDNIKTENRKARKIHICSYCGSSIYKGETYENQVNTDGGVIYEWKSCKHCEPIVLRMWKEWGDNSGDGLNDQDFGDFISENDIEFVKR